MRSPKTFFALLWLCVAACVAAGDAIHALAGGTAIRPFDLFFHSAAYVLWVPLVPFAVGAARRFAPAPGRLLSTGAAHIGLGLLLALLALIAHKAIFCPFLSSDCFQCIAYIRPEPWFFRWLILAWFVYGATVTGVWLLDALDTIGARELLLATRQRELSTAQVQLVHARIPPETLERILDTIATRLRTDSVGAEKLIAAAGSFLRATVRVIRADEMTLADDLEMLGAWAVLESARRDSPVLTDADLEPRWREAVIQAPLLQPAAARLAAEGAALLTITGEARPGGVALRVDCSNGRAETVFLPLAGAALRQA